MEIRSKVSNSRGPALKAYVQARKAVEDLLVEDRDSGISADAAIDRILGDKTTR